MSTPNESNFNTLPPPGKAQGPKDTSHISVITPMSVLEPSQSAMVVSPRADTTALYGRILEDLGYAVTRRSGLPVDGAGFSGDEYPLVVLSVDSNRRGWVEQVRRVREAQGGSYMYLLLSVDGSVREAREDALRAGADAILPANASQANLEAQLLAADRFLTHELERATRYRRLADLSVRDGLTGLYNRRYLFNRLPLELKRASRYARALTVVLFDLDHFKEINDTHGHQAGDEVLLGVAGAIARLLRADLDWVARYGGDEFIVVLPETGVDGASVVLQRMIGSIHDVVVEHAGVPLSPGASFGAAVYRPGPELEIVPAKLLISAADKCLYLAKNRGRGQSVLTTLERWVEF